jgi:hypothetical protein
MIDPLFETFRANFNQSLKLTRRRDTLLPKLLSGKIELPAADALSEEVS